MSPKLHILALCQKPNYPIIIDVASNLLPIQSEADLIENIKPSQLIVDKNYYLVDSRGISWLLSKEKTNLLRIYTNIYYPRITKRKFVDGFNSRKDPLLFKKYSPKVTHFTFEKLIREVFFMLTEEFEEKSIRYGGVFQNTNNSASNGEVSIKNLDSNKLNETNLK